MLDKNTIIKVTNRDNGSVGYSILDMNNLHRTFMPGETKEITMEELNKLSYQPGGNVLLKDYFIIDNKQAVEELLGEVEPEYYYTEKEVKELLLNGSLDALKDCIDYAPEGTLDLVKKLAVDLKINDIAKRQAILEMTGFNVNTAIMANEETEEEKKQEPKVRRLSDDKEQEVKSTEKTRRTSTPTVSDSKYKIIK